MGFYLPLSCWVERSNPMYKGPEFILSKCVCWAEANWKKLVKSI